DGSGQIVPHDETRISPYVQHRNEHVGGGIRRDEECEKSEGLNGVNPLRSDDRENQVISNQRQSDTDWEDQQHETFADLQNVVAERRLVPLNIGEVRWYDSTDLVGNSLHWEICQRECQIVRAQGRLT